MHCNLILLLVGIAFFSVSTLLLVQQLKSRKNNTASVMAEVMDYSVEVSHDSDGESVAYYPILRYCVSDQWYEKRNDVGRGWKKYDIGERVEILYDPQHPENFIIAGDKLTYIVSAVGIILGIGVGILAFL